MSRAAEAACHLSLPSFQVVVPRTYAEYTSRRVLTTQWLEGEKLSQSQADDVGTLVNVSLHQGLMLLRPGCRSLPPVPWLSPDACSEQAPVRRHTDASFLPP